MSVQAEVVVPVAAFDAVPDGAGHARAQLQGRVRAGDNFPASTYDDVAAGIVEVDANGRLLRVNRHICQMTGYAASELLGRTVFQATLRDDVEEDMRQFRRQVAGEIDRYTIEKRILCKNGVYLWAAVTSSSISDAAGTFLYAVRVQHDITDRKRAEDALARRMNEQAALFAFTERLQCLESVDQVFEPA